MVRLPSLLALLSLLVCTSSRADAAGAAQPTHLTSQGRWMITGDLGGFYSTDPSSGYGAQWRWGVWGSPGVVYFLKEHVGLGAFASVGHRKAEERFLAPAVQQMDLGGGVRALFDAALGEKLSLVVWPWLAYFGGWRTTEGSDTFGSPWGLTERLRYLQFGLSLPLVYRVNEHVGFGLGPHVTVDFLIERSRELESAPFPGAQGATAQQRAPIDPGHAASWRIVTGVVSTIMVSF